MLKRTSKAVLVIGLTEHPAVQVERGRTGDSGVISRINKIRPNLESLDLLASFVEGGQ